MSMVYIRNQQQTILSVVLHLHLLNALASSDEIDVHHLSIRTGVVHVADGSVTSAKIPI